MKKLRRGVILNVASTAGLSPRPKLNWYNASKGWMITATKAMAIELAPFNVRVNAIAPVAGLTPLLKSFKGGDTPQKKKHFCQQFQSVDSLLLKIWETQHVFYVLMRQA